MRLSVFRPFVPAALFLAATACGSPKQAPPAAPPPDAKRVDDSKTGALAGRVLIEGSVPANVPIRMMTDPSCMRAHPDGSALESYVVDRAGGDAGLENVFVYVKDGLGPYYFDIPTEPVRLDQEGCRYTPHVIGLRAGQPIEIHNSDETLHNVNARPEINQGFNIGQSLKGRKDRRTFTAPEVMIPFMCDVHKWMNAFVGVLNHPYFAVTRDGGKFQLKNLPAGTYTIEAWHEKLGTAIQQVTIAEKESKEITFTFKAPATD